jgi:hypothetical protein
MVEFNNNEDQNIWSCLEDFEFSDNQDVSKLRVELYLALIKSIGCCGSCVNFSKADSFCSLLLFNTSSYERCSDFERVEEETDSAFDIMSEEFRREQENLSSFTKIRKYQRMPHRPHKEDKAETKEKNEGV